MKFGKNNSMVYKWNNILKSRHFRSSSMTLFLITTLLFLFIGILTVIQNKAILNEQLEIQANHTALNIQECLSNMRSSAVFMAKLPSISLVLSTKDPSLDNLIRMSGDILPYTSIYSYTNICTFFERSQRIFDSSGGMYEYTDFYNPNLIEALHCMQSEDIWLIDVPYERYYSPRPSVSVIIYARKLPLYESGAQGYVTVSYPMKSLQKLASESSDSRYASLMSFNGRFIWSSSVTAGSLWNPTLSLADNEQVLFPKTSSYTSVSAQEVQCTYYLTAKEQFLAVSGMLMQVLYLYLALLPFLFASAVTYSVIMLRPVDDIMKKIGIVPYTQAHDTSADEFTRLGTALDNINTQMSGIKSVMHENQQLIRERLLSGILYHYADITHLPSEYEQHGILFSYPYYAVILISLPSLDKMDDYTRQEQLKMVIRSNTASAFSVLGTTYSLYPENRSICIILNTKLSVTLQEELLRICEALKKRMTQSLSIYPLFSIGLCSETDPKPWQVWQLARRNFIFTAADSDDFVLFSHQSEFTSSVDPDLLHRISQSIIDKDAPVLKKLTGIFALRYLNGAEAEEGKRLSIMAFCTVYASLLDVQLDIPENVLTSYIHKLENSSAAEECSRNLDYCFLGLLDAKNKISPDAYGYIRTALEYLEQNYACQITIPQIAQSAGISPIYLTKIIKLSTGKTLSEYLNYYRTQRSLRLLIQTSSPIHEIGEQVGYNDVRSYIRFFKKFYHMTPGEYRKEHL